MIAVNASTSPQSSVSFTPFGSVALTLVGEGKWPVLSDFANRSSPRVAARHALHRHAAIRLTTGMNADVEMTAAGPSSTAGAGVSTSIEGSR